MPPESDATAPSPLARRVEWRFFVAWLMPLLVLLQVLRSPEHAGYGVLVFWVLVAGVDAFWPGAQRSPPPVADSGWHRAVLRVFVPLQFLLLGLAAWAATGASWSVVLGLGFAVGWVTGAQGITYAHELGHSGSRLDRFLAWCLMTSVGYSHFMVEHYRGHHVRAATQEDPASARFGESLYAFLPRTLAGSLVSAWRLEALRLRQLRRSWWHSPLLLCTGLQLGLVAALLWAGQTRLLVFWLVQAGVAVLLLETVNYIEHYGLRRRIAGADRNGRREPFGVMHAWNADHAASNALLANLQRHADHHMHAAKPYATLQPLPQGPQLPTGYAGCLMLALLPPLWFAVMHPRLRAMAADVAPGVRQQK